VLAGIYEPTSGTIHGAGRRAPLFDIQVGLDEEATGYECIQLRGLMHGIDRAVIQRKAAEIAAFSELGDYLNLPVRTYSSGMLMRLFFSIATSVEAEIVLMDEWIGVGDERFVEKANKRLHALIDRAQILAIASHDRALVSSCVRRGILLGAGASHAQPLERSSALRRTPVGERTRVRAEPQARASGPPQQVEPRVPLGSAARRWLASLRPEDGWISGGPVVGARTSPSLATCTPRGLRRCRPSSLPGALPASTAAVFGSVRRSAPVPSAIHFSEARTCVRASDLAPDRGAGRSTMKRLAIAPPVSSTTACSARHVLATRRISDCGRSMVCFTLATPNGFRAESADRGTSFRDQVSGGGNGARSDVLDGAPAAREHSPLRGRLRRRSPAAMHDGAAAARRSKWQDRRIG
jgi:energy-coupling factor transporter ATP-binding protein EcfA2